jgi:hypothetical protein
MKPLLQVSEIPESNSRLEKRRDGTTEAYDWGCASIGAVCDGPSADGSGYCSIVHR